jgi:predicted acylesterase/phospholipase RssA
MSTENNNNGTTPSPAPFNLVCGSGGSRAILGGSGAILTCHLAGIRNWQTIGGASGGSIPTALLASGMSPAELVRCAIDIDFASLLTRKASWFRLMIALMLKYRYDETRPVKGVFGTRRMEDYINSRIPAWPKNFWTVAMDGKDRIIFTANGVFRRTPSNLVTQISTAPPSVGTAVCASCAVPGILDAVKYQDTHLFDGALGDDGRVPIDVLKQHYSADPSSIVACDVGEDSVKNSKLIRFLWKFWCRNDCQIEANDPDTSGGLILLQPTPVSFHALRFSLSPDMKWQAVMNGVVGAINPLCERGFLQGHALDIARNVEARYAELLQRRLKTGQLAVLSEQLLADNGLL